MANRRSWGGALSDRRIPGEVADSGSRAGDFSPWRLVFVRGDARPAIRSYLPPPRFCGRRKKARSHWRTQSARFTWAAASLRMSAAGENGEYERIICDAGSILSVDSHRADEDKDDNTRTNPRTIRPLQPSRLPSEPSKRPAQSSSVAPYPPPASR